MLHALTENHPVFRVPGNHTSYTKKCIRAGDKISQRQYRKATLQEISDECGLTLDRVETVFRAAKKPVSTSAPVFDGVKHMGEATLESLLKAEWGNPTDNAAVNTSYQVLEENISKLKDNERRVVKLRMAGFKLKEIGDIFGFTEERARQIWNSATDNLKHPSRVNEVKEALYIIINSEQNK